MVQRNLLHFNGGGADGLIDNGQDLATRQARTRDGRLQLNGAFRFRAAYAGEGQNSGWQLSATLKHGFSSSPPRAD